MLKTCDSSDSFFVSIVLQWEILCLDESEFLCVVEFRGLPGYQFLCCEGDYDVLNLIFNFTTRPPTHAHIHTHTHTHTNTHTHTQHTHTHAHARTHTQRRL